MKEEWKKIKDTYKTREIIALTTMGIIVFFGAICDWNALVKGNILIFINDIEAFSLTILQIQATVGTLIFTIIALITGNISDSYMGISLSDFYLNIKPWKLTQKILILISLGLCLASAIFHAMGFYNIVFGLFIATLIVILISILEIYSSFGGRNQHNQEIEAYIIWGSESKIDFEKRVNLYEKFVLDWSKVVSYQDKQDYEKYFNIYKKYMRSLWNYETDRALSVIEQQSYNMSFCLFGAEKKSLKGKGLEFVQEIYVELWKYISKYISEGKSIINRYENGFHLFSEISSELIQSVNELNVEEVEKRLDFGRLVEYVLRVTIWLDCDKKLEESTVENPTRFNRYTYDFQSEVGELNYLAQCLGRYLGEQKNKNSIINQFVWNNVLNGWSLFFCYSKDRLLEERSTDFWKAKASIYFSYCYGMMVNGQENIVRDGVYLNGMRNEFSLDNKYQALLYLAVHSYVYYLAVREEDDCVTRNIRQSALNIWDDKEVKNSFITFLNSLSEKSEWMDLDMLDKMLEITTKFELHPQYESYKMMVIEIVVIDFYLFIVLFMSREFYCSEFLEKNIDDMRAFRYVTDKNDSTTKEMFRKLYEMVSTNNESEEQVEEHVNIMYDDLEKMIKKKQKERSISQAVEEQNRYVSEVNAKTICEKIQSEIEKSIKEEFQLILFDKDKNNETFDVTLLNLLDYTKSMGPKKSVHGYYSHMHGMLLRSIADYLIRSGVVNQMNRFEELKDDKTFMQYLELNNLHLLLGSQYIFTNRDYKMSPEYKRFLNDCETIFTTSCGYGIALKENSIQVCLHDINVSIHSPSIDEVEAKYNEEEKKYYYPIFDGFPIDFEEDELSKFLYNYRKVINVTAKISVKVNEKKCGIIFSR